MRRSLFDFKLVKHCQSAHLQWSASGFVSPIVFLFLVFAIAIPAIPILSHPFLSFRSVVVVTKEPSVASMRCSSACVLGMIRTMSWPLEPKQDAMFHAIETAPGVLRGASFFLGQRLALHCQILSEMHMFFLAQCSDIKWFVSPNSVVGAGSDANTTDGIVDGHAYTVITCLNDVAGTEQLNGSLRWWGARWHKQSVTVSSCSWFFWKENWRPSGFCRCPSLYYNL